MTAEEEFNGEDKRKKDRISVEKFCVKVGIADCDTALSISSFEFDEETSEDDNIREVLKALVKKMDRICDDMEPVLDPGNSICDIKEAGFFDDASRKAISEIFGKNKHLIKKAKLATLEYDRQKSVALSNEIIGYWKKNREGIIKFYERLVDCWEQDERSQYSLSYFG